MLPLFIYTKIEENHLLNFYFPGNKIKNNFYKQLETHLD